MRLVLISDTHCALEKIPFPEGDVLIHCGDLTYTGTLTECSEELEKLGKLRSKYKKIYLIAGNHDWLAQKDNGLFRQLCEFNGITYLQDSGEEFEGLYFYGSPWQPEFCNWAFNLPRGQSLKNKWDLIPDKVDVLITHGPPYGILDEVKHPLGLEHVGCKNLYKRIMEIKPKINCFGHIHERHGFKEQDSVKFLNVACLNDKYKINYLPTVINI